MSRATKTGHINTLGLWAVMVLLALGGCSEDKPSEQVLAEPGSTPPPLSLVLRINGSSAPRLTPDLPVYLGCTIRNPRRDRALKLQGLAGLRPAVRHRPEGATVATHWVAPAVKDLRLGAGRSLRLYWVLQGNLPPGSYLMTLKGTGNLLNPTAGLAGVRIRPVYLEVVAGRAPPQESERLRRRTLVLRGERQAYLEAVRRALASRPQDLALRWELVQALELNQRPAEALRQLTTVIAQLQRRQPGRSPAVPYWCLIGLRELVAKAKMHHKGR